MFAWILMGFGAWSLLAGGLSQGLWLLLIGWFLNNAARVSYERMLVREALDGVRVSEMMLTRLEAVSAQDTAKQLVEDQFMTSDQRAFPVVSDTGRFLGLVCFEDVRKLPREKRAETTAADLMTPAEQLVSLPPDAEARSAMDQMARRDVDQIPVLEDGKLLGLVRRRDVLKWLAFRNSELDLAESRLAGA
jgi:CBS domain-containing protein